MCLLIAQILCAQILYGNLAPEGCVGKITGKEGTVFEGPARVFDSEEAMLDALSENPQALKVRFLNSPLVPSPSHGSISRACSLAVVGDPAV